MVAGTREHRSAEKRRLLLDAAERIYYRDGDLGLTVRRLAAEGATTSQTIYTYFGSRDAVVDGMYERALAEIDSLLDGLRRKGDSAPTPLDVASAVRRHALAKPGQFRMLAAATGPEGTDHEPIRALRSRVTELLAGGSGPSTDPAVLLAAINGFVTAEFDELVVGPSDDSFVDLVKSLT